VFSKTRLYLLRLRQSVFFESTLVVGIDSTGYGRKPFELFGLRVVGFDFGFCCGDFFQMFHGNVVLCFTLLFQGQETFIITINLNFGFLG